MRSGAIVALLALCPLAGMAQIQPAAVNPVMPRVAQELDGPHLNVHGNCRIPHPTPDPSRSDDEEGMVVVGFLVGPDGQVRDSKIVTSSGNPANDQIVAGAFADCGFTSTGKGGQPITDPVWTRITFRWPLNGNTNVSPSRPEYQTYLTRFFANASLRQEVERRARAVPLASAGSCAAWDYRIPDQPEILQPLKFNTIGHVTGGALKYAVPAQGCGESRQLNVFITIRKEQSIEPITGMPGATLVPAEQQKDVAAAALVEMSLAAGRAPDCESRFIIDTQLREAPAAAGAPWREDWIVARCAARYAVPLLLSATDGRVAAELAPGQAVTPRK